MALQPFDLLCPHKWNSKNRFHCMKESHNHVSPSVIPLLLMWLMDCEGEDRWRRLCDFPAVKMKRFAWAALALDSFFTPARTANLSGFNQPASSLAIFGFLSLTGLAFHHSSFFLHFASLLSSPKLASFSRWPFPCKCHSHVWKMELNLADRFPTGWTCSVLHNKRLQSVFQCVSIPLTTQPS